MLKLVREVLQQQGVDYAWHTGETPLPQRREEIRRFMGDAACRVFLSTDSGSVGLNLQQADTVINLDLPWNPAKLEQRIARAWRKHQRRPVQVINLVCEASIESRMLNLLEQKRSMANEILDGTGAQQEMALPSGRRDMIEKLTSLTDDNIAPQKEVAPSPVDPREALRQDILARWQDRFERLELYGEGSKQTLLAVTTTQADAHLQAEMQQRVAEHFPEQTPQLELLDRNTFDTLQRLIAAGVISMGAAQTLHNTDDNKPQRNQEHRRRQLKSAQQRIAETERQQQMASLLANGGFTKEAIAPLHEAIEATLQALASLYHQKSDAPVTQQCITELFITDSWLPAEADQWVAALRQEGDLPDNEAAILMQQGAALLTHASESISQALLQLSH